MENQLQQGFTLVELLITLAITAILLALAWPSFASALQDAELRKLLEQPRMALYAARSHAIKSSSKVTVCPQTNAKQCGTDWSAGLLVFVDSKTIPNEKIAVRDSTDRIVRVVEPSSKHSSLTVYASDDRTAAGIYSPKFIRFSSNGHSDWKNGTVLACDNRGEESALAINVALTGDIRKARPAGDNNFVRDAFGREIDCP